MAASIADYLLALARDPAAAATHRKSDADARAAMSAAGLSAAQQDAILSKDSDRISKAIQAEFPPNPGGGSWPVLMVFMIDLR
ncbi:MAG TPA: hypothetical protein VMD91_11365 [Candidatus Sulfotelmatobacter sp.]|nr:hypothetical protein [Candidatus Sulfotelmatobacter sp.]